MTQSSIELLAAWSVSRDAVPPVTAARRQARLLLLDTIGCALAAVDCDPIAGVLRLASRSGGEATIIGSGKASLADAVLANGALVRVLDFNDVMFAVRHGKLDIAGHRSDNIPVALAVAEVTGACGADVLDAIILNYELYGRLRAIMPPGCPWDGASASGIVAAVMAGRLLAFDAERQADAIALAAARCATPMIVRTGRISAAKSIANALTAQAGVQAALLAGEGLTGPLEALDDELFGLKQVFDCSRAPGSLWAPIGDAPEILFAHMKSYPSIGTSQCAIKAALDLRQKLDGDIDVIDALTVVMADTPAVRRQQADPDRLRPTTREAADHSFVYVVAAALIDGELTQRQFDGERWRTDARLRHLMERITLTTSEELARRAPTSMPAKLVATLGARTVAAECLQPPGHSAPPMGLNEAAVIDKFSAVTRTLIDDARRDAILNEALTLEGAGSVAPLMALLYSPLRN